MNIRKWDWENLKDVAFMIIGVLLILSMWALNNDIDRNYEADLEDRAVACRSQLAHKIPLSKNCLDLEIRDKFNPDEQVQITALQLSCQSQRQNNKPLAEGCPDG